MPTDKKIELWSKAFDTLTEANRRLEKAINRNDRALEAYKIDHRKALEAYDKATDEIA